MKDTRLLTLLEAALGCRGKSGRRVVTYDDRTFTIQGVTDGYFLQLREYPVRGTTVDVEVEPEKVEWW